MPIVLVFVEILCASTLLVILWYTCVFSQIYQRHRERGRSDLIIPTLNVACVVATALIFAVPFCALLTLEHALRSNRGNTPAQ